MPDKATMRRANADKRAGKSASTQAGEFVREEIEHVREGKHGARNSKQAIAIGLSKARRAGVDLPQPKPGRVSERTRKSAARDTARGQSEPNRAPSRRRSRATLKALKREDSVAVSPRAMARQGHAAARSRTSSERSTSARKAAATKGAVGRKAAARKAAKTRQRGASA